MDRVMTTPASRSTALSSARTAVGVPPQRKQAPATRMPAQRTPLDRPPGPDVDVAIGSAPRTPAKVLVADPVAASRQSLTTELVTSGLATVIEVATPTAVRQIVMSAEGGDLALVSMEFGDEAIGLVHSLLEASWRRVIALAPPTVETAHVVAMVRAGACGVLRGQAGAASPGSGPVVKELSEREIEVLTLVADGRSNRWIAAELSLSPLTVKSHLARISRKLGTGDRSHLVAIAMRHGVIS